MSAKEIKQLLPKIYLHFTDILLESIKGLSLSKEVIFNIYKAYIPDSLIKHFESNQNIVAFGSHYGNWELGSSAGAQLPYLHIVLYKPMSNKYIDQHIKSSRELDGCLLTSIYSDKAETNKDYNRPKSIVYLSDQNPSNKGKAHPITFFNRETLALHGAGDYAKKNNLPVYYYKISKLGRTKYRLDPILLANDVTDLSAQDITQLYFNHLEQQISAEPAFWLWTHKRWKTEIKY